MENQTWAFDIPASSKYEYLENQSRYDYYDEYEEVDIDEDMEADYPCPFCSEDFDIVGLCGHIEEEHPVEAKKGVCPMCGASVGVDIVEHVAMQHENIYRSHTGHNRAGGDFHSLYLSNKELEDRIPISFCGSSSPVVFSSNAAADTLLTSFICSYPVLHEPTDAIPTSSINVGMMHVEGDCSEDSKSERVVEAPPPMPAEKLEERTERCNFVQSVLLSTMFDDIL